MEILSGGGIMRRLKSFTPSCQPFFSTRPSTFSVNLFCQPFSAPTQLTNLKISTI